MTISNFYKQFYEQKVDFIFLVNWKKIATSTLGLLHRTYGEDTLSRPCLFELCKRFLERREIVEDLAAP